MKKKTLKTYLTLPTAAERYNIQPEKLQELIDQVTIRAALLDGEPIVLDDDVRAYIAERDVSREQFKHLEGPIMLSEAAEKYHFPIGSLDRWVVQGHIRILSRDGYRVFVNEADIAYARAVADTKGLRSGRPLFERRSRKK